MDDISWIRNLDGKPAVISGRVGDLVEVSVEREHRVLTREEWLRLPGWEGGVPPAWIAPEPHGR